MKTLIVYASKHGCTLKAAEKLVQAFGNETQIRNVRDLTRPDLEDYERVIIGGSIHAGRIQAQIKKFAQKNLNQLLEKNLGLFICHMEDDKDKALKELTDNFPDALVEHATAKGLFGGEFDFDKMNFFEKFVIKKIANVTESVFNINDKNIENFITAMQE